LTTQIGWLSVYYLNAAHWAISGIEVGNDCPKRNLTVISQRSVQGGYTGLSFCVFLSLSRLGFHALLVFQFLLRFFLSVQFLLLLSFLYNSGQLCYRASGCRNQTCLLKCFIPSAEALFQKPPANDLLIPGGISQVSCTIL
jgi:hypothetical protein